MGRVRWGCRARGRVVGLGCPAPTQHRGALAGGGVVDRQGRLAPARDRVAGRHGRARHRVVAPARRAGPGALVVDDDGPVVRPPRRRDAALQPRPLLVYRPGPALGPGPEPLRPRRARARLALADVDGPDLARQHDAVRPGVAAPGPRRGLGVGGAVGRAPAATSARGGRRRRHGLGRARRRPPPRLGPRAGHLARGRDAARRCPLRGGRPQRRAHGRSSARWPGAGAAWAARHRVRRHSARCDGQGDRRRGAALRRDPVGPPRGDTARDDDGPGGIRQRRRGRWARWGRRLARRSCARAC